IGCFARVAVTGTEAKFIDKGQAFHKPLARHAPTRGEGGKIPITVVGAEPRVAIAPHAHMDDVAIAQLVLGAEHRSEERSGGKECVRTCRSRGQPYHYKKN